MIKKISMLIFCITGLSAADGSIKRELPAQLAQTTFSQADTGSMKHFYSSQDGMACIAALFLRQPTQQTEFHSKILNHMHEKLSNAIPCNLFNMHKDEESVLAKVISACQQVNNELKETSEKPFNLDIKHYGVAGYIGLFSPESAYLVLLTSDTTAPITIQKMRRIDPNRKMTLAVNIKTIYPGLKELCYTALREAQRNSDSFSTNSQAILSHIKDNAQQKHHQTIVTLIQTEKLVKYIKKQQENVAVQTFIPKKKNRSCCLWPFSSTNDDDYYYEELTLKE